MTTVTTCRTAKRILIHFLSVILNCNNYKSAETRIFSNILVKLGPDYLSSYSYSGSGLWLVRMWTGSRAPIQAAQAPTVGTSKGGSQAFKRTVIRVAQLTRSAGSVNMEWTNDATLQLISEYENHVLWDSYHDF